MFSSVPRAESRPLTFALPQLLRLLRPYWALEATAMTLLGIVSLLGLVPAMLTKDLIDRGLANRNAAALEHDIALIFMAAIGAVVLSAAQGLYTTKVAQSVVRDLRLLLISRVFAFPMSFFTEARTGEVLNRVVTDVDAVDSLLSSSLPAIASNVITLTTSIAAMSVMDWRLTLVSIVALPLMVMPVRHMSGAVARADRDLRESRGDLTATIGECISLQGMLLMKLFTQEEREIERVRAAGDTLVLKAVRLMLASRAFYGLMNGVVILGPALVWLAGGLLVISGHETIGTVVAFTALLARLYGPASTLTTAFGQIMATRAVFGRISDYFDHPVEKTTCATPILADAADGVSISGLSFSYGGEWALSDVTLRIPKGTTAALVGPSGSGKSSLAYLLLGLYGEYTGRITLDGVDAREASLHWLRSKVTLVTQEPHLLHDTIENNIRYGVTGATNGDVRWAARQAQIAEFIDSLEDGYKTIVGAGGYKLSGGQRQRIAIARALLRDSDFLIFDEATSSLDTLAEREIAGALERLKKGRTCLLIAHRLSTIEKADKIYVIDRGRVREEGTHNDLIRRDGLYRALYDAQRHSHLTIA